MKKSCILVVISLLLSNPCLSLAQEENPFIAKDPNVFTLNDQKRLESKITEECNTNVINLEQRLNDRLRNIESSSVSLNRNDVADISPKDMSNYRGLDNMSEGMSEDFASDINRRSQNSSTNATIPLAVVEDPITKKIKDSFFIGCFDDQVLFRNNETKEKFFLSLKEVENNEEFKKISNCNN